MKEKLEIIQMLVLSTGHLPQREFESLGLSNDCNPTFRFVGHEYGAIIVLYDISDVPEEHASVKNLFPALWHIIEYAAANNIGWINFDQDGELYEMFEKYEW